jgi:hypothetical protein
MLSAHNKYYKSMDNRHSLVFSFVDTKDKICVQEVSISEQNKLVELYAIIAN